MKMTHCINLFKLLALLIANLPAICSAENLLFPIRDYDERANYKIEIECDIDNAEIKYSFIFYLIPDNQRTGKEKGMLFTPIIRGQISDNYDYQEHFIIIMYPGSDSFRIKIESSVFRKKIPHIITSKKECDFYLGKSLDVDEIRAGIHYVIKWSSTQPAELTSKAEAGRFR